ncbi:enoyl-CoA hydratase/isomerase family protein [Telmatospirillum sp. J64-1]|uniref:enoyl-CoA hydratase/isomerase family protein n=1 Tax=Telmatospirillum sp. J64-1 TaxID=2502183 RepID=UPI00115E592F|nr:enoyl-CoA hydratase/isomerase family protein [Telmatospirillum sp. J64-1]
MQTTLSLLDGIATLTLNRPEVHNAFDDRLIAELTERFLNLGGDPQVRVVVLAANGPSFSAGGDLAWMKRIAANSEEENLRDAMALARLMEVIDSCPKPVLGLVQGPAYGGGVGLAVCCDIVIAAAKATFCLSEVKLGLIPATIMPYVLRAIGHRAARRYVLSAERFDAAEAQRLGLVHEVVEEDALWRRAEDIIAALKAGGPAAQAAAKEMLHQAWDRPGGEETMAWTARRIAEIRASSEGQEGLAAFLEKRKPAWLDGGA